MRKPTGKLKTHNSNQQYMRIAQGEKKKQINSKGKKTKKQFE